MLNQKGAVRLSLYRLVLLVLFGLSGPGALFSRGQDAISELDIKAAFILNTAKYVEWPSGTFADETSPIRVAVYSTDDEMLKKFTTSLGAQKVNGRSFTVKRINAPQDAREAEIVFIGEAESRRTEQVLEALKGVPALTIGESQQFFEDGGMIHIFWEKGRIRWEINLAAAEKAKIVISSKFLGLARRVIREGK